MQAHNPSPERLLLPLHFDDGNIEIDIDVNNLSPEMDNILNSPITIEEIKNVVFLLTRYREDQYLKHMW
jgi:hypothetical protein